MPSAEQLWLSGGCEGAWQLPGPVPAHPHHPGVAWAGQGAWWGDPWLLGWSCSRLLADRRSSCAGNGKVEVGGGSPAERVAAKRKQKHDVNEPLATGSLNQMLSDEFSISPIVACTSLPFGSPHLLQMWFNLLRLG